MSNNKPTSLERMKLETEIERAVFKFVNMIKEHLYDNTMLYLNRQQIDFPRDQAGKLLELAQSAVQDGLYSKIEFFKKDINKALDDFSEQENPLRLTK